MIIEMREKFKSYGFKVILWITLIAMIIVFLPVFFQKTPTAKNVIVRVNESDIDFQQYYQRVQQEQERISALKKQFGPQIEAFLKEQNLADPKQVAMRSLIQEELINQAAETLNIRVSPKFMMRILEDPSFVINELSDVIPFYLLDPRTGEINRSALEYYLQQRNMSFADFEAEIENALKRKTIRDILQSAVYISKQEVNDFFVQQYAPRKYTLITFELDPYLEKVKKEPLSEEAIKQFFQIENKRNKRYWIPEKRAGLVFEFDWENFGFTPSEKAIQAYYEKNKRNEYVKTPVQVQVRRILLKYENEKEKQEQLKKMQDIKSKVEKNPDLFVQLVKEFSQDKKTNTKAGLLPWFSRGKYEKEFESGAFRLEKDGDISDIITTKDGIELLQRVGRKPVEYTPIDEVHSEIVNTLAKRRFPTSFNYKAQQLIRRQNEKDILSFIKEKNAKKITIENQERKDFPTIKKLYQLKEGDWGYLIDDGRGYLVKLSSIEKSYKPKLSTVKDRVKEDLYTKKAKKMLQTEVNESKALATQKIRDKEGILVESTDFISKDDEETLQKYYNKGIPLSDMFDLYQEGAQVVSETSSGEKVYLIRLNEIQEVDSGVYDAKIAEVKSALYNEKANIALKAFIASLKRDATIRYMDKKMNIND